MSRLKEHYSTSQPVRKGSNAGNQPAHLERGIYWTTTFNNGLNMSFLSLPSKNTVLILFELYQPEPQHTVKQICLTWRITLTQRTALNFYTISWFVACLHSGKSCFEGRTTVGMIRLWRAVSSSVASSKICIKNNQLIYTFINSDFLIL